LKALFLVKKAFQPNQFPNEKYITPPDIERGIIFFRLDKTIFSDYTVYIIYKQKGR